MAHLKSLPNRPLRRASIADRVVLRLSTGRYVDGLWIGTFGSPAEPKLHRIEQALQLIKRNSALHYRRVTNSLDRIWVNLLPDAAACYQEWINACVFDERFVLDQATTLERLAMTIVHEATHARLRRQGLSYEIRLRPRIESICLRRELAFAKILPDSAELQAELMRTLEWCATNPDYFSDQNFQERDFDGRGTAMKYLGMPSWLVRALMSLRSPRRGEFGNKLD
jgi:hypothetical protein